MTTYRLPDGREVELLTDQEPIRNVSDYVWARDSDLGLIQVPMSKLTEVKPPIPAEPEPGAYLIGDVNAMCVDPGDWRVPSLEIGPTSAGWTTFRFSWPTVWEKLGGPDVTITPLVPSVPVEPVQLPWEFSDVETGDTVKVELGGPSGVWITTLNRTASNVNVISVPVREMIAALSAADRSEQ